MFGSGDFSQIVSGENDQFGSNDFNQCNNRYDAKVVSLCRESHLKARASLLHLCAPVVPRGFIFASGALLRVQGGGAWLSSGSWNNELLCSL